MLQPNPADERERERWLHRGSRRRLITGASMAACLRIPYREYEMVRVIEALQRRLDAQRAFTLGQSGTLDFIPSSASLCLASHMSEAAQQHV